MTQSGLRALVRPLRVFAFDPSLGSRHGNVMTLSVAHEPLTPGPRGRNVAVTDYDASNRCYYAPVNLDDPDVVMEDGLPPSEADPRFHQQMAYAVAVKTMENFSYALGRRVEWRKRPAQGAARPTRVFESPPLRVFPHAMQDANAYYDPDAPRALPRLLRGVAPRGGPQPAGPDRLHLPVPRHHRARDDSRPAPRPAAALPHPDGVRRGRLPRGPGRPRGPPAALRLRGRARRSPDGDRGTPARPRACPGRGAGAGADDPPRGGALAAQRAHRPRPAVRRGAGDARRAAQRSRHPPRRVGAAEAVRAARARGDPGGLRVRRLPQRLRATGGGLPAAHPARRGAPRRALEPGGGRCVSRARPPRWPGSS